MKVKVSDIASALGLSFEGDGERLINGFSPLSESKEETIGFFSGKGSVEQVYASKHSAIIIPAELKLEKDIQPVILRSENPEKTFFSLLTFYQQFQTNSLVGISPKAEIDAFANLGEQVYIGPWSTIEAGAIIADGVKIFPSVFIGKNVSIGEGTVIYPNTVIHNGTIIGKSCIIHSGVVIGTPGFGYRPNEKGELIAVPQVGIVEIEDNVDIGANSTIDCATMGKTVIGKGTKIDNLVQVAHNVKIGKHNAIAAQVGIAGSAIIGSHCLMGGKVGVKDHGVVPDFTKIGGHSAVGRVDPNGSKELLGYPAVEAKQFFLMQTALKQLPELLREFRALKAEVKELKSQNSSIKE